VQKCPIREHLCNYCATHQIPTNQPTMRPRFGRAPSVRHAYSSKFPRTSFLANFQIADHPLGTAISLVLFCEIGISTASLNLS
jgi:hypothetical protein